MFIAPSVTPWRYQIPSGIEPAHNPGARLIKYDRTTGKQLDIIQYYVSLDVINADNTFEWLFGYNATSLYGINDITAASMDTLINKMTGANSQEFHKFVLWYNTNVNSTTSYPCDTECYTSVMCGLRYLTKEQFESCIAGASTNGTAGLNINYLLSLCLMLPLFCILRVCVRY